MTYLYQGHMGGLYTSDEHLDYDILYCEQCGDSDWFLGTFETIKDFWNIIKDECDIDGNGGWSLQYIYPMIVDLFDLPDILEYENEWDKDTGICDNRDEDILARIEELIKEK